MASEINAMVSDRGEVPGAILATGSVVSGDWLFAYQTSTDDMFPSARSDSLTVGSVAMQRLTTGAADSQVCGIALQDAASGDTLAVATEGMFIGTSTGSITAGAKVMPLGQGVNHLPADAGGSACLYSIGRALTGASAASKYVLFKLNL